jgi:hypothetical protein
MGPNLQFTIGRAFKGEQLEGEHNSLQIKAILPGTADDHHLIGAVAVAARQIHRLLMPRYQLSSHRHSPGLVAVETILTTSWLSSHLRGLMAS